MKPSSNNVTSNQPKTTSNREFKKSVNYNTRGTMFFQIGLILSLLMVIFLMQVKVGYAKVEVREPIEDPFFEPVFTNFVIEKVTPIQKKIARAEPIEKRPPIRILTKDFTLVPDDTKKVENTSVATTVSPPVAKTSVAASPPAPVIDTTASRNINQVEFVPVFPGCESLGTNEEKKACMSSKISAFISKKFRTDNFDGLSRKEVHKIHVQFKIDALGNVTDVRARAPHKDMQDEGERVINKLPKMTPGRMGDINVTVSYIVPISFKVE